MLKFRANMKPMALKRPRLVRNSIVYDPSKKDKKNWLKRISNRSLVSRYRKKDIVSSSKWKASNSTK